MYPYIGSQPNLQASNNKHEWYVYCCEHMYYSSAAMDIQNGNTKKYFCYDTFMLCLCLMLACDADKLHICVNDITQVMATGRNAVEAKDRNLKVISISKSLHWN